ncbi:MAG: glycerol-3-phosphate 1-O-acyltransferase PlsY [Burkholderiaceae bacterium]|nr:glycerol-3-phosphate 1-O-acyltransferase PlsY [Burkholderiaceae bacterium]
MLNFHFPSLVALAAIVLSYLLGSLSFAVIVSKLMGKGDPRTYGSGNPGATNVLRSGSKGAALATLLLDGFKSWLPVALILHFGAAHGLGLGTAALAGLAAFIGHLYPVFFRFQGGKGVATAAGALLGISWALGVMVALVWLAVAVALRYSSLAALVAAVFAPVLYLVVIEGAVHWSIHDTPLMAISAMSLLLFWRHRANIVRLWEGVEPRIGQK